MIELCNGYYIEIDPMNFTLKKRYEGERKETKEKFDAEKVCGYFSTLDGALERFVKLNQIDLLPRTGIDLTTYLELVRDANLLAVEAIKKTVEGTKDDNNTEGNNEESHQFNGRKSRGVLGC